MAKVIYQGKTAADIAKDLELSMREHFPDEVVDSDNIRVNVWRWLNKTDYSPSSKFCKALYLAGYKVEPFIFGVNEFEKLEKLKTAEVEK